MEDASVDSGDLYQRLRDKLKAPDFFSRKGNNDVKLLQKFSFNFTKRKNDTLLKETSFHIRFNNIETVKKQRLQLQEDSMPKSEEFTRNLAKPSIISNFRKQLSSEDPGSTGSIPLDESKDPCPRSSVSPCSQMQGWQRIQELCDELSGGDSQERTEIEEPEAAISQDTKFRLQLIYAKNDVEIVDEPKFEMEKSPRDFLVPNNMLELFLQSCAEEEKNSKGSDEDTLPLKQKTTSRNVKIARQKTSVDSILPSIVFDIQSTVEEIPPPIEETPPQIEQKENVFPRYQLKKPERKIPLRENTSVSFSTIPNLTIRPKLLAARSIARIETLSEKFKFVPVKKYEAPLRSNNILNTSAAGSSNRLMLKPKNGGVSKTNNQELQRSFLSKKNVPISTQLDKFCQKTIIDYYEYKIK